MQANPTPVDMAAQRAIYALVMAAYPKVRTIPELAASLEASPGELLAGINWEPGESRRGQFRESDG